MANPTLPTKNNWYEFDFLYQLINQFRGIGGQIEPTDLPALPDEYPPTNTPSGLWYGLLQQIKHIGDNLPKITPVGAVDSFASDADGETTVVAASTASRIVQIIVTVTEVFADGDGSQPAFTIGATGALTAFADGSDLEDATAGSTFVYSGTLDADDAVIVDATPATGTTSTGAIDVSVVAVPVAAS